ncbi:MAG: hypothetical protein R3Y24_17265 [Eubacteriales bacterium]
MITEKEKLRLRQLATKQLEFAHAEENNIILKKWNCLAAGKRETPTVRLLFSNFTNEVITPRLECETPLARKIEAQLLHTMVGRELFGDDTPISPTFDIQWDAKVSPFGISHHVTFADGENPKGFHIDPVIGELEEDMDKLRGGNFHVNKEETLQYKDIVDSLIGDILPTKMVMNSLTGAITNPLVHLMGMENYYFAMMDYPDEVHEVMEMATRVYESYYDYLEKEGLLLPTNGISGLAQESFAFTNELPSDHVTKTTQCWGFLESQETTAVSPETFGEFVFPYQDRLVKRFGLLSYGCCERVDAIWENYLSKWKNLRKLSVAPFNNEMQIGEYLRGSNVIYYSKPRAEFVTNPGPIDEAALMAYYKEVFTASSGCLLEVAQREVGTIYGDFERGRKYVELTKEAIEKYWRP